MNNFKNFFLIVLAFIAGSIVSLGTTLVIAHGGDTNLVHACVRNNTLLPGAANIRIVGANVNCNTNETALDWSKTGSSGGGLAGLEIVTAESQNNNDQIKPPVTALCPTGKIAISGGGSIDTADDPNELPLVQLTKMKPNGTNPPTGWIAEGTSPSGFPTWKVTAYAICVNQ